MESSSDKCLLEPVHCRHSLLAVQNNLKLHKVHFESLFVCLCSCLFVCLSACLSLSYFLTFFAQFILLCFTQNAELVMCPYGEGKRMIFYLLLKSSEKRKMDAGTCEQ